MSDFWKTFTERMLAYPGYVERLSALADRFEALGKDSVTERQKDYNQPDGLNLTLPAIPNQLRLSSLFEMDDGKFCCYLKDRRFPHYSPDPAALFTGIGDSVKAAFATALAKAEGADNVLDHS